MVETDAPFLTPNPVRGKPNQPAYTVHTAKFLADLRSKANGEDPDQVLAQIHQNSERFFALKK
ncbi:MAG TPA: TatD family hydrolase [Leptospiraceae bacterium]|nr:TatD family hydrolase [Leptospiraceae bacterium]